jgi:hypothetical protein
MAYKINNTFGTLLVTLADGTIDVATTDLTLIGKGYAGFGEKLNENLIKLLENFNNTTAPTNKQQGQLWYDRTNNQINVYTGSKWKPVGIDHELRNTADQRGAGRHVVRHGQHAVVRLHRIRMDPDRTNNSGGIRGHTGDHGNGTGQHRCQQGNSETGGGGHGGGCGIIIGVHAQVPRRPMDRH